MQFSLQANGAKPLAKATEVKCGAESAVLGLSTTIGPILLFLGMFGAQSIEAAFWATIITATAVRAVRLLFGESPAILSSCRAASLTAYVGLVLHLSVAMGNSAQGDHSLSTPQLLLGLAAGSMMFAAASGLIFLSGVLKLGSIFKMIPSTVTAGIANSTALVLIWLAVKEVLHTTWLTGLAALAMMACVWFWPTSGRVALGLCAEHCSGPRSTPDGACGCLWPGLDFSRPMARSQWQTPVCHRACRLPSARPAARQACHQCAGRTLPLGGAAHHQKHCARTLAPRTQHIGAHDRSTHRESDRVGQQLAQHTLKVLIPPEPKQPIGNRQ